LDVSFGLKDFRCRIFQWKGLLERPTGTWEDNIKMHEIRFEHMDWKTNELRMVRNGEFSWT
jgi:hypothetical protein